MLIESVRRCCRRRPRLALLVAPVLMLGVTSTHADSFGAARYDARSDTLDVTLLYRGTNPGHEFTLRWGGCGAAGADGIRGVAAQVLDDQWRDASLGDYSRTVHFKMDDAPCRPAWVTLRTSSLYHVTVFLPRAPPAKHG